MVEKEYNVVKNTFEKVALFWFNIVAKTKFRKELTTVLLVIALLAVFFLYLNIFSMLLIVLLILSVRYANTQAGKVLFYVGIAILILISYILWIIPIAIGIYLLYAFLNELRIKRIQRVAKMSPSQLSGIRYQTPEVEITIRGGRRK